MLSSVERRSKQNRRKAVKWCQATEQSCSRRQRRDRYASSSAKPRLYSPSAACPSRRWCVSVATTAVPSLLRPVSVATQGCCCANQSTVTSLRREASSPTGRTRRTQIRCAPLIGWRHLHATPTFRLCGFPY